MTTRKDVKSIQGTENKEDEHTDGRELRWDKSHPVRDDGDCFQMRVKSKDNAPGNSSGGGWFYNMGTLTATPEKIEFSSKRANTTIDFDAVEVIQHRNDSLSHLFWLGPAIFIIGLLSLLLSPSLEMPSLLILTGIVLFGLGAAGRGDSIFIVTANRELQYRTINQGAAQRAVRKLNRLKQQGKGRGREIGSSDDGVNNTGVKK